MPRRADHVVNPPTRTTSATAQLRAAWAAAHAPVRRLHGGALVHGHGEEDWTSRGRGEVEYAPTREQWSVERRNTPSATQIGLRTSASQQTLSSGQQGAIGACMTKEPTPFEVHESGNLFHGTKADLQVGDLLEPGRRSNYGGGRTANHVYLTATLDAATWGAELAVGEGRGRIYIVEPLGTLEDDPNVTDKRFPGNPTRSYRTRDAVRIVGELVDWVGHSPEKLTAMREHLDELKRTGTEDIDD
jgi:rifampin ADP-ribosylating transferase